MIPITCAACHAAFEVPESQIGQVETCPECGRPNTVCETIPGTAGAPAGPCGVQTPDLFAMTPGGKVGCAATALVFAELATVGIVAASAHWSGTVFDWMGIIALLLIATQFQIVIATIVICHFIARKRP